MEPVEGQNRTKFLKLVDEGKEDRISALPDCLIVEILYRLPSTKYAIKTGTLSKRWKLLWTLLPTLIFKHVPSRSDFVSFVDKTITQCRQLKLKKFEVHTGYTIRFGSQLNNWIHYAIRRNVEELNLTLWSLEEELSLDQCFFINTCFTDLRLTGYVFYPVGAISWKNLRRLYISFAKLDEDLIENILSGSPLLETLKLNACCGFNRLDITSKSVKKLLNNLYGHRGLDIVEINAPNILSLAIKGCVSLRKLLLVDISSIGEAYLDYYKLGYEHTTRKEEKEEMLKGLILSLRHVKELKIGVKCSEVVSRLKAKGFVIPSNMELPEGFR